MINISYIPAYDPYHAKFRILALLPSAGDWCDSDSARIADFFLCFPHRLDVLRTSRAVPGQLKTVKALRRRYIKTAYTSSADPRTLFRRMRAAQFAAMNSLVSQSFLKAEEFRKTTLFRTEKYVSPKLAEALANFENEHGELILFLRSLLSTPLAGPDGLKARSTLQEYRYDNV